MAEETGDDEFSDVGSVWNPNFHPHHSEEEKKEGNIEEFENEIGDWFEFDFCCGKKEWRFERKRIEKKWEEKKQRKELLGWARKKRTSFGFWLEGGIIIVC